MKAIDAQIRRMLATELRVQESSLTDDFAWLDAIGIEDSGYFLARINEAFAEIPQGFSLGAGRLPFRHTGPEMLKQIATVGALIEYVRSYTSTESVSNECPVLSPMAIDALQRALKEHVGKRVRITYTDGMIESVDLAWVDDEGFGHSGPDGIEPRSWWTRFENVAAVEIL